MKILKDFYLDHKNEVPSYIPKKNNNNNKPLDSDKKKDIIEMNNGENIISESKMTNTLNKNLNINIDINRENIDNTNNDKKSENALDKQDFINNIFNKQEISGVKIKQNNKVNQIFGENSETKIESNIIDKDGPIEIDNISLFD